MSRVKLDSQAGSGIDRDSTRHAHGRQVLDGQPNVVQERLGHSSIQVSMDIYSSVAHGTQREAVERLATSVPKSIGIKCPPNCFGPSDEATHEPA